METHSYIELTFTVDLTNETISFDAGDLGSGETFQIIEQWTSVRGKPNKVTANEAATSIPGERSAINFVKAFNSDYNATKLYEVTRIDNLVKIASFQYGLDFDENSISAPSSVQSNFFVDSTPPFTFSSLTFDDASPNLPCKFVSCIIETTQQADSYSINGGSQIDVLINPFNFVLNRGLNYTIEIVKSGLRVSRSVSAPPRFFSSGILIDADNNPGGSTVNVSVAYQQNGYQLNFEYSLDNVSFQTSPTFPNMVGGDYTIYVRDQFECVVQKDFSLTSFGILSPYFSYSKSNSIRMANRIDFGDSSNYKNDENTLSCEVNVPLPEMEVQLFQSGDIVTTQFKTNYTNAAANVKSHNGTNIIVTGQTVVKMTENMGLTDSRDAVFFYTENFRPAVYFTSGNIYDFDTGADIDDYTLNGALPEWGRSGNYLKLGSSWYLIEDVIYIEEKNAECLILTSYFLPSEPGDEQNVIVGSIYNRFNYEVYEFVIDMADYLQYENIIVQIPLSDPNFDDIDYESELINIKIKHENTLECLYWNKHNTDIFFSTGIQHKIRIPIERIDGAISDEHEVHKTDSNSILLSAEVYELDVFEFSPITKEMMRKLVIALHHSELFLDGVKYVKEAVEVEGALEDTNLYIVKATMIKAQNVYNSDSDIIEFNEGSIEIPALIGNGDDFVKYQ